MHPILFLGRFHVLILHLPITLILVVAVLEWMNRGHRRPDLDGTLKMFWAATAITAVVTVILGYMHFAEGGFTGPSAIAHRALGTTVAAVSVIGWLIRSRGPTVWMGVRVAITVALVVLVTLTGHFGGNLTHGDTYLVEFAPNPIRRLAGLEVARPPVTDLDKADPFLDVVEPLFAARCASCHNRDKARGGLNLGTFASVMKGGKDGPVIIPGDAKNSDLIRRISLSPDKDEFMPKEGKTPLTANQVAVIRWWVQSGAKKDVQISALNVPADVRSLLQTEVAPKGNAPEPQMAAESLKSADPKLLAVLNEAGFMARQESRSDAHLAVSPLAPGARFGDQQLTKLAVVPADQVSELDLRGSGLTDQTAGPVLSHFKNLTRLRVDRNKLGDQSVSAVKGLAGLEVLGVYSNSGITDASVDTLIGMKSLKKVFLWGTGVSAAGVEKLRKARPDLQVDFGDIDVPQTVGAASADANKT